MLLFIGVTAYFLILNLMGKILVFVIKYDVTNKFLVDVLHQVV